MSWITICQSCIDCGAEMAFLITENAPTQEQINRVTDSLGGMYCISVRTKEIEEDEINVIND